jgi:uncharacterized protein YbaR (Trm112 family)
VSTTAAIDRGLLREALASVLACPRCEGSLDLSDDTGHVICGRCGASSTIDDGIVDLSAVTETAQEGERHFRDRLAGEERASGRAALLDVIARHHGVAVMRRRAREFAGHFGDRDWLLDIGIGWGWHWMERATGPRIIGVDISMGNLRLARRMLGESSHVLLVRADAVALPIRSRSVSGVWSVQALQHMPDDVLARTRNELDRVLRDDFRIEIANLNPSLLLRAAYRLRGKRLHRRGRTDTMELNRRTAWEWATIWRDFRPGRSRVSTRHSELFFHPDLFLRPRPYPLRLERALSRVPLLPGLIARQVDVAVVSAGGA